MKKIITLVISFLLFPMITMAIPSEVTGRNIILYNLNDNEILYEQNSHDKVQIASLTKIMTTITALKNINDLNAKVTITSNDFLDTNGYSKAGFKIGEELTYLDLLYGIILPSGIDAVNAVINNTLGYEEFINKMNDLAKELKMKDTHFSNPVGKDDLENYSSAYDISLLLRYALDNPTFKEIFTTKEYITTSGRKLERTINYFKDKLNTEEILGAKSGYTEQAGRCLASITTLNDVNYLLVVIGSSTSDPSNGVKDSLLIYDYYKNNYGYQNIIDVDTYIKDVPVILSKKKNYSITGNEKIRMYLENNSNITYKYEGVDKINYKTKKGSYLGKVNIYNNDVLLTTSNLYLKDDIKYYPIELFLIISIVIILGTIFIITTRRSKKLDKLINESV